MNPEISALRERLVRIERRWTIGWVAAAAVVATVGVVGQDTRQSVEAQRFIVTDPNSGDMRAVLEMSDDGPVLRLYDQEGTVKVVLGLSADGPTLTYVNPQGEFVDVFNPRPQIHPAK